MNLGSVYSFAQKHINLLGAHNFHLKNLLLILTLTLFVSVPEPVPMSMSVSVCVSWWCFYAIKLHINQNRQTHVSFLFHRSNQHEKNLIVRKLFLYFYHLNWAPSTFFAIICFVRFFLVNCMKFGGTPTRKNRNSNVVVWREWQETITCVELKSNWMNERR